MGHISHDLYLEFPTERDLLYRLKLADGHFQALSERYRVANEEIHRLQTGFDPATQERLEMLKKQRLALLDEITEAIAEARGE